METNFQKIKQVIERSSLSQADKDMFLVALLRLPDAELAPVLTLLQEDSSWTEKLLDNFKKKENAAISDNPYMWEDAMKEEEIVLKQAE